jgi:hypothetical protein
VPQHQVVRCYACGHGYDGHAAGGGPCLGADQPPRCPCPGFRWIDPESPGTGPYTAPPLSPA